jgi:dTDP-4-amino-4,6-dideoxygalactose transaminase
MHVLIPLGSCSEAFELAPVVHTLRARGARCDTAWFGSQDELAGVSALGSPQPDFVRTGSGAAVARLRDATDFVAGLLESSAPSAVLSAGHSTLAVAACVTAAAHGTRVVRLDAGQRSHDPDDPDERDRRIADHAAGAWFVASEFQRQDLLREGLPASRIRVVGSTLPTALAALAAPSRPAAPFVWLALEHAAPAGGRGPLAELLGRIVAAARARDLRVLAAAPGLPRALAQAGIDLPGGITIPDDLTGRAQLDAARRAAAILTDSAGYQAFAAAARVPCLVLADRTARPETVASGHCRLVGVAGARIPEALALALDAGPANDPPWPDATAAVADALPALFGAVEHAAAPAAPPLPTDADQSGRTLGDDEVALAAAAIRSGTLNSTRGTFVRQFEHRFAQWLGSRHAIACASGTAAVHAAIAALHLAPGDEVVTTPITDMGAITPILYEGGVPVFADVDPRTLNVTAATIEAQLTARTRAVVVTHLFGLPCDLEPILALARERGLPVIEDCAQAFGATIAGRKVGTFGALATFSLQQGKHITCGEGGIVATDDDELAERLFLFVNKAWGYGRPRPDHGFPALNGRLSELQGAVALAQLGKLDHVVERRRNVAGQLIHELADLEVLRLPGDPPHGTHSYWRFPFTVDAQLLAGGAAALGKRMQDAGIACVPRYIQKPAFECGLFRDWRRSPVTWLPLQQNPRAAGPMPVFERSSYPGAVQGLDEVVVLPINERYEPAHVAHVARAIRAAAAELQHA